jgi:hypothetical protein
MRYLPEEGRSFLEKLKCAVPDCPLHTLCSDLSQFQLDILVVPSQRSPESENRVFGPTGRKLHGEELHNCITDIRL